MLITSARPLLTLVDPSRGETAPLGFVPSYYQGHGAIKLDRVLRTDTDFFRVLYKDRESISSGETKTYTMEVAAGQALFATLVWDDAAVASTSRVQHACNTIVTLL
jgi:hypothetical protein